MDRRVEKTKEAIRKAYFAILAENDSPRAAISQIAKRANIDRKTFYLHYETVDDIIREYCHEEVEKMIEAIRDSQKEKPVLTVEILFDVLNSFIAKNLQLFEIISAHENKHYFFDQITHILGHALEEEYRRYFQIDPVELNVYVGFFISGIMHTYDNWLQNRIPMPIEKLAALVTRAAELGLNQLADDYESENL